ncbi:RNA methyltransferase [Exilibacterium tricleocarpae]|uniref:RNA methyltransferase n=1 Tax=Exilibacterium tricleocarpae TaxID=2591008 RepID=A0A545SRV9_9GAMM|nr:RNA methyltransferase [Exilibacterium tricleocarpae]TQV67704.1 RNA methyltransferase [Exilibacterium tricleocarpae]
MPKPPEPDSDTHLPDSDTYLAKKRFFDQLLTVYGRKPVMEALQTPDVKLYRLHLADSNRPAPILDEIRALAEQRGAEVVYHSRQALARISKNSRQDQGVAADLHCRHYQSYADFLQQLPARLCEPMAQHPIANLRLKKESPAIPRRDSSAPGHPPRVLALCSIHNPQNLGMIIRSACAGDIDGILIPQKGCATISSSLVIKASAGTLFKAPILSCEKLKDALQAFKGHGFSVCALSSQATESLFEYKPKGPIVYVLGNESEGVSDTIFSLADKKLRIPMSNEVESLNVAVTAALIAFSRNL